MKTAVKHVDVRHSIARFFFFSLSNLFMISNTQFLLFFPFFLLEVKEREYDVRLRVILKGERKLRIVILSEETRRKKT